MSRFIPESIKKTGQRLSSLYEIIAGAIEVESPDEFWAFVTEAVEAKIAMMDQGEFECETCGERFTNDQEQCSFCGSTEIQPC